MFYSDNLTQYEGALPLEVQQAIAEIQLYFNLSQLIIYRYDDNRIAVRVVYEISLPTRGAIDEIDIREEEPVLIIISLSRFPNLMPLIASDRKDFPTRNLPHLYVSNKDAPSGFCLVRNNRHEWFANKTVADLLTVGSQWLYKAGNGLLVEDNNEYDPTRIEKSSGYHIYKYRFLRDAVLNKSYREGFGFSILMSDIQQGDGALTYNSNFIVEENQKDSILKFLDKYDETFEKQGVKILFSLLLWDETNSVEKEYSTNFPSTYGGLKEYFKRYNIDLEPVIAIYMDSQLQKRNGLPLIHAIRRPKKIVGYDGDFEFINFLISASGTVGTIIPDEAEVSCQLHNEPFNSEMAQLLSNISTQSPTMFIGAGSLGSKLIIHEARSGNLKIGVIDGDSFLQHNIARHTLFEDCVGKNKAEAIIQKISDFFKHDAKEYEYYKHDFTFFDVEKLKDYRWMVDTTASRQVMNLLVRKNISADIRIARAELVDDGRLGLLCIEGANRNPRVDDLFYYTCYLGTENKKLRTWRKNDEKRKLTNLDIGLGCSSSTTVMADETISYHSALISKRISTEKSLDKARVEGLLFRTILDEHNNNINIATELQTVPAFELYDCFNKSGWEVRFRGGITRMLVKSCKKNAPDETGGVLVGIANYKTKTIHVFDIMQKTKDSKGTPTEFKRGIQGLPKRVNKIRKQTGQVIGYIGEWHTHPMNFEGLSMKDMDTVLELAQLNSKVPIPTLSVVVTKSKIIPFVF